MEWYVSRCCWEQVIWSWLRSLSRLWWVLTTSPTSRPASKSRRLKMESSLATSVHGPAFESDISELLWGLTYHHTVGHFREGIWVCHVNWNEVADTKTSYCSAYRCTYFFCPFIHGWTLMLLCIDLLYVVSIVISPLTTYGVKEDRKTFGLCVRYCLQCFDTVGWAAGRASGL